MPDIPVQNGSTRFRWRVGFSDYFAPGLSAGPRRPSFPAWPGIPTTKEASSFKELAFLCIPALVPRPLDSACGGSTSPAAAGHFRRPDTECVQQTKNAFCVQISTPVTARHPRPFPVTLASPAPGDRESRLKLCIIFAAHLTAFCSSIPYVAERRSEGQVLKKVVVEIGMP